eukprot:13543371-Alexandrium_andersonii.AAC.1
MQPRRAPMIRMLAVTRMLLWTLGAVVQLVSLVLLVFLGDAPRRAGGPGEWNSDATYDVDGGPEECADEYVRMWC